MKKNTLLYLTAAIAFDLAAFGAIVTYFTSDRSSNTWLILGIVFAILALPMYLLYVNENKK